MNVIKKKFLYEAKSEKEIFAKKVYNLIVDNFAQTFFVGGMVRDLLLGRVVDDIDIATSATPGAVADLLEKEGVVCDVRAQQFGLVRAQMGDWSLEITTLRKDVYGHGRYPQVEFVSSAEEDSQRRDFTINALYLSQKDTIIFDFHDGLNDIEEKIIRFIGEPAVRIAEDPLRIVRAIRFAIVLDFLIEKQSVLAMRDNFALVEKISPRLIEREADKILNVDLKKIFFDVLHDKKLLDTLQK